MACACGGTKTQRPPRWVLNKPNGEKEFFGSRLEADARYVETGRTGEIKRV